tara:strand:+ start:302 stop:670 length:369 start_codon:yes stop_codon:yes gene_type:complete
MEEVKSYYLGSCHCEKVRFKIYTSAVLEGLYKCNCSLCTKKSIVMKPVNKNSFFLIKGKESLSLYQWNKNIAEHYFCQYCGIYTHHRRRRDPSQISVNFACLDIAETASTLLVGIVDGKNHD